MLLVVQSQSGLTGETGDYLVGDQERGSGEATRLAADSWLKRCLLLIAQYSCHGAVFFS